MKNLTKVLAFALLLGVSLYACDTKKDPAPVVPPAPTGFTAAQVAGVWKLTAGSVTALNITDIFDPAGATTGDANGRAAFCNKNSVLTLKADGTFTDVFLAGTYIFPGQADQPCTAASLAGTFAVVATTGALTLTYAGGNAPRSFVVKTVTATTMTSEITTTVPFTVVTTITHIKQ